MPVRKNAAALPDSDSRPSSWVHAAPAVADRRRPKPIVTSAESSSPGRPRGTVEGVQLPANRGVVGEHRAVKRVEEQRPCAAAAFDARDRKAVVDVRADDRRSLQVVFGDAAQQAERRAVERHAEQRRARAASREHPPGRRVAAADAGCAAHGQDGVFEPAGEVASRVRGDCRRRSVRPEGGHRLFGRQPQPDAVLAADGVAVLVVGIVAPRRSQRAAIAVDHAGPSDRRAGLRATARAGTPGSRARGARAGPCPQRTRRSASRPGGHRPRLPA